MHKTALLILASGLALPATALAQGQGGPGHYIAVPLPEGERPVILPPMADAGEDLDWNTIDSGGGRLGGGGFMVDGTVGQWDTMLLSTPLAIPGMGPSIQGGFWSRYETYPPCYANCDFSTMPPSLNIADFTCFLQKFAASDPYANCDGSTVAPILNVADFSCFLQNFAAGCPF